MNSIIQQNEYIRCPNCSNLIASFAPSCSKCGLLTGSEGVIELAAIDRKNRDSLVEAQSLISFSAGPIAFLFLALVFSYIIPPWSVIMLFIWSISQGLLLWKLHAWHREFGVNNFPDEDYNSALVWRSKACAFAVGGIILAGLLIYSMVKS